MADEIITFDEILADPIYKSEFDRRVTKAISTVQGKLDAEVRRNSTMKSSEDYVALEEQANQSKAALTAAQTELEQYRREKFLLSKGIPAEDVDYYAFKIGKLVTDSKNFEQAAEEYLKDKPTTGGSATVHVDMSGALSGGNGGKTPNDTMNALIRGARK